MIKFVKKIFVDKKSSKDIDFEQTEKSLQQISSYKEKQVDSNVNNFAIHKDLENLIWFAEGTMKNYRQEESIQYIHNISIRISTQEEPSLIYTSMPVSLNTSEVPRPPYFPNYKGLSPEQKKIYWDLLANPYDSSIDIGYVFILYYGLERNLLIGDYEKAYEVIMKLRRAHNNLSFQAYSENALLLTAIGKQREDLALRVISEIKGSDNHLSCLHLLCKMNFGIALQVSEIINNVRGFGFNNTRYIKTNYEMFYKNLQKAIAESNENNQLLITNFLSYNDLDKLKKIYIPIYANISIKDRYISLPDVKEHKTFRKAILELIQKAHDYTKTDLTEIRKASTKKRKNIIEAEIIEDKG